jgi:hypothetical protein
MLGFFPFKRFFFLDGRREDEGAVLFTLLSAAKHNSVQVNRLLNKKLYLNVKQCLEQCFLLK